MLWAKWRAVFWRGTRELDSLVFGSNNDLGDCLNTFFFDLRLFILLNSLILWDVWLSSSNNFDSNIGLVVRLLKLSHNRKSPDHIRGTVLKTCAEQPGGIFQCISMEYLQKQRIPAIWKHSIAAPVAKCSNPIFRLFYSWRCLRRWWSMWLRSRCLQSWPSHGGRPFVIAELPVLPPGEPRVSCSIPRYWFFLYNT